MSGPMLPRRTKARQEELKLALESQHIGHPKTQTMQTADCRLQTVQTMQTVQTVQTEYFFFLFLFLHLLLTRSYNDV